ncbi:MULTISPECIES: NAD(P)/FAD-dependent oxidoreductase [Spirosoma]|uniref:NADH:ubiquinone reductase (non-electrogenic) n=1 Tax=Spirosoma liriopis TaxID=2937440 RepID=A0ABT0HJ74_9BACT|nr:MULTISPECIES: NAD(P)/FAD-dependent oxidoreductase [Spirosoma]MCK8492221.1 NAD(P)/FAD-dependent oxidoreductase [Spirosoma liriopis]UHG91637.1 NAD(P)/FAD-dependent oxidoreductase [Spirosoma oryzicola]
MLQFDKLSLNIPDTTKPRVVIIGGGFGGMNLAKSLKNKDVQVVLLDKQNYNGFWPLLYQVATAGLEPDAIAEPFRKMFDGFEDFHYRMVRVNKIDPAAKTVTTTIGDLHYDYLVIATGTKSNFFGNEQIKKYSFPLKTIPEALNVRSQFLQCFEQASVTTDPVERQSLLTFVIAGAGPTGVEMAGSLAEMRKHVLPSDYPGLDFSQMKIYIVEGLGKVLPPMSDEAGQKSQRYLEDLGVIIKLNTLVESYDGDTVTFKGGEQIRTQTLVWGAGVTGALIDGIPAESIEKGRVLVDPINRVIGLNDVFAIGDIAFMKLEKYPRGHPGVAQPAIQQGVHLAKNLRRLMKNEPTEPFEYFDKGSLAIVGRSRAVADLPGNIHLGGFIAWISWLFVHIWYLVGFRSKLIVFSNWIYRLFTYERGTRIIIRPFVRKDDKVGQEILLKNEMS